MDGSSGASGFYDLRFTLYDAPTNGAIIGAPIVTNAVAVSNGVFGVALDFGSVFADDVRWLGIEARTNGGSTFIALTPRQGLTPSLQSLYAANAGASSYANTAGTASTAAYATASGSAQSVPWSALPGAVLTNAVSLTTNATLADSFRLVTADIETYGANRFRWTNSINALAANGRFRLWMVGSGWACDGEFFGVLTNLLAYKPFAGYGSSATFLLVPSPYSYGQFSGSDTAIWHNGDDTNWHQSYFSLEAPGQITAPSQVVTSDVTTVSFLSNPNAGSFVVEVRTNGYNPLSFLQLDSTWTIIASVNASNAARVGSVVAWTNTTPMPTQVRVRATSAGSTPVLEFAQWDSTVTNGVVLGMFAHVSSGDWARYTETNVAFPIWAAQAPTMVLLPGGWGDVNASSAALTLDYLRRGFPSADLVDITAHEWAGSPTPSAFESSYCWNHGIPFFNGEAASTDAWGSYAHGVNLGLYWDTAHLTPDGFALFSQLVWAWLDLTAAFVRPVNDLPYHFDGNFQVSGSTVSLNPSVVQLGGITSTGGVSLINNTLSWQNGPTGAPANPTTPAAWMAVTNNGVRYYLPLYR